MADESRQRIREERRNRVRERVKALAQDPEYQEAMRPWLQAAEEDLAAHLKSLEDEER